MSGVAYGVAAITAAASIYSSANQASIARKNAAMQSQLAKEQANAAQKAQSEQEQAFNKANQKRSNTNAFRGLPSDKTAGTLLTGSQGIGQSGLNLGQSGLLGSNTLLGE